MTKKTKSKDATKMNRYKLATILDGEILLFKRYGTDKEKTKSELIEFVKDKYGVTELEVSIMEDVTYRPCEKAN